MTAATQARRAPTLALAGITKTFGATRALEDAGCVVRPGTIHALLGENGAGKTTLMRVAFGLLRPDAGEVRLDERPVEFGTPADAIAAGLGMVQQHFSLVPAMTVAENVALGGRGRFDARRAADTVARVAADTGLAVDPRATVGALSVSAQQRVEIVKALAHDARVLMLDEPTAVLAPDEVRALQDWLRRFVAGGGSAVLITHKLDDALALADDITVLRRGRVVRSGARATWDRDGLVAAMLGPAADAPAPTAAATAHASPAPAPGVGADRRVVLELNRVSWRDARGVVRVRDVSCRIHAGELVGVAAVEGSGQHELLRLLAGRLAPTSGTAHLPADVGFVPEDRHREAVLLEAPLRETVALRGAHTARGRLPWTEIAARTDALVSAFDVRGGDAGTEMGALSGGNQQKLVLARELDPPPAALVVENPVRGLDLRATEAVLTRLRAARDAGIAVVMYASDLDEVLSVADRVLVMFDGRVHEVPPVREAVGRAMLGLAAS